MPGDKKEFVALSEVETTSSTVKLHLNMESQIFNLNKREVETNQDTKSGTEYS